MTCDELCAAPFHCVNCFSVIEETRNVRAYCSELYGQEADWVRYARRCHADGRDRQSDVKQALRIRLALVLGGGYPKLVRQLPESARRAVFERDGGRCRICGEPGTEIDHGSGNSADLANLQLLCDSCHNKKTISSFVKITKESHPQVWARREALIQRAMASQPLRLCDAENWSVMQRELLTSRRAARSRPNRQ